MGRGLADGLALAGFILAVSAAASFGALYGPGDWYRALEKPFFNPPNWVFGPVWTMLYIAIAASGWLLWRARHRAAVGLPLTVYFAQLLLNGAWTWIFFGLHRMGLALVDILVLELCIVALIVLSWRISRTVSFLLMPYAAWVAFASLLNASLWWLNA
ncbi:MAG: hypothetical protein GC168_17065 [Candidatus Hydrogenedens sp.]|nr:hypothetical protein [Candidatus Hydrogenedens sp.]